VNVDNVRDESRIASGRLFLVRGPATVKDLSPNEVRVRSTWSLPLSADLIPWMYRSTLGWQNSARYSGARPLELPACMFTSCRNYPGGKSPYFLWKLTWSWSAVKACYIWLNSLDPLQQLLGGQPFQQATVTLKFKMASNMAAIFWNIHNFTIIVITFSCIIHHFYGFWGQGIYLWWF